MTAAELVVSLAASVGLVLLAYLTIAIVLMAWRKVHTLFSEFLDGCAVDTK